jgi:hypothetical protein
VRHTFIVAQFVGPFDKIIIECVLSLDNSVKTIGTLKPNFIIRLQNASSVLAINSLAHAIKTAPLFTENKC